MDLKERSIGLQMVASHFPRLNPPMDYIQEDTGRLVAKIGREGTIDYLRQVAVRAIQEIDRLAKDS